MDAKITNITDAISKDGRTLTLTVDLTRTLGPSASGKTMLIASTKGDQTITLPDGSTATIGLNVYQKK